MFRGIAISFSLSPFRHSHTHTHTLFTLLSFATFQNMLLSHFMNAFIMRFVISQVMNSTTLNWIVRVRMQYVIQAIVMQWKNFSNELRPNNIITILGSTYFVEVFELETIYILSKINLLYAFPIKIGKILDESLEICFCFSRILIFKLYIICFSAYNSVRLIWEHKSL